MVEKPKRTERIYNPPVDLLKFMPNLIMVKKGDTLSGIIRRAFPELKTPTEIAKAVLLICKKNPNIKNPDDIRAGQTIELPSRENIRNISFDSLKREFLGKSLDLGNIDWGFPANIRIQLMSKL